MENREATLYEVLNFREKKAEIQREMCTQCPEGIVVSLGMNIPGPVKSGPLIHKSFLEGRKCLESLFKEQGTVIRTEVLSEKAGYAAIYLLTGVSGPELKKAAVRLEETHSLGRIFDIDVLGQDGNALSREQAGAGKRTCLLCGKEAKACGRSRTHSVKALQEKVFMIMETWKQEEHDDR